MSIALSIITAVHLCALSQLESGDNPKAVGKDGERTVYQVGRIAAKHEFKMSLTTLCKLPKPQLDAKVKTVWQERINHFVKNNHVQPTVKQIYMLWNCPADVLHPSRNESERAERFANLYGKFLKEKQHS